MSHNIGGMKTLVLTGEGKTGEQEEVVAIRDLIKASRKRSARKHETEGVKGPVRNGEMRGLSAI